MGDERQWYTNKELFEQIIGMKEDFSDLRREMSETRSLMKKYNGLREEIGELKQKADKTDKRVRNIEAKREGKQSVGEGIIKWGGWIFGALTLIVTIARLFI